MAEAKKMTDKKLFALAAKQKQAKEQIKTLEKDAETYSQQIIAELQRRGVKALESENDGIRINKTEGEFTTYDVEAAEETLTPAMFKRVTKRVIDPAALTEAITAGKIKARDLKKFATTASKKPYITVSYIGGK